MKTLMIKFNKKLIQNCIIFLLFIGVTLNAQDKNKIIISGERISIKSKILNEKRDLLIYLPDNYSKSNEEYPVIYVLDGNFNSRHVYSAASFLNSIGAMPNAIVVGIVNIDRNRDFSPTHTDQIPTSGGAELFHKFINRELIPHINKKYRTCSYKILFGHSFGGTFATYSLLEHSNVFNSYISVSPYLMYDDNDLLKRTKMKIASKYNKRKSYFMTLGDEPKYYETIDKFNDFIKTKNIENFHFKYKKLSGETHGSNPYLSAFYGLEFIFSGWKIPNDIVNKGLDAIDDYYKNLSKEYDYKVETPENTINFLGYKELRNNEFNEAIKLFKENVKRYSKSANVYDSLGEAYEKNNQLKLAKKNYKKAYDLGLIQLNRFTLIYKGNYDRVSKKLSKE